MSNTAPEIGSKTIAEKILITCDFVNKVPSGGALVGTPTVTLDIGTSLTIDDEARSGTVASCTVAAGVAKERITLKWLVTDDSAVPQTLVGYTEMDILDG